MKARTFTLLALLTAAFLAFAPGAANARDFLEPGDIERADTSQAVITISRPEAPQRVRAIRFLTVPDLQSCFSLAYQAVNRTRGESSATCINAQGVVAATYFCAWGSTSPQCRVVQPR